MVVGEGSAGESRVVANVVRGALGNLIEWYDWYVYAAFSGYFAPSFFPAGDSTAQLLATAGVFAVGFVMRPIGGWVLGRYADRFGRRAALTLSVTMMAAGSLLVAVTPSYRMIGLAAPVLLLVARLVQGLSVGGEYGSSSAYLSEVASPGRRGFYSSFQGVTLTAGQLVALGVQLILQNLLDQQQLQSWGWRAAFVVGAGGALAVLWLRRGMDESEAFRELDVAAEKPSARQRGSLRELLHYPRECLIVVGVTLGGTVAFYTFTTYLQQFMVNTTGLAPAVVTRINFAALLLFVLAQPLVGALSDRVGRRPVLLAFGITGTVGTIPLLTVLAHVTHAWVAFGLMILGLAMITGYTSINVIVKAELFPTRIRALGVGLPFALTTAVFGGTAEVIALALKRAGHESWFFAYVAGCIAVSLVTYVCMRETAHPSRVE